MKKNIFNKSSVRQKRKILRAKMTKPEKIFWSKVRGKRLGVKFRRQHSIGEYIVDFYCSKLKLVIEIDGKSHFTKHAVEYDLNRTKFLNSIGVEVIRFTNYEILYKLDSVIKYLRFILDSPNSRNMV